MTEPIVNGTILPTQLNAIDEGTMTTGTPIDEGGVYESITVPLTPEQTGASNKLAIRVEEAMYEVVDPEPRVNVVDLGLVYDIWIEEGDIAVIFMALASPAYPLTDMLTDQIASEVIKIEGIRNFRLNWVWSSARGPHMITEDGHERMRALSFSAQMISDSGDQRTATLKILGDELLARSARHSFICTESLAAFVVGIGRAMRNTDYAYFENGPKNGLKASQTRIILHVQSVFACIARSFLGLSDPE